MVGNDDGTGPAHSSLCSGVPGRVDDDTPCGMHTTFVETLCDSIISGQLASRHCSGASEGAAAEGAQLFGHQPGAGLQDVRSLAALLAGYMLMNCTLAPGGKHHLRMLCVSEVQCIIQDALANQDETAFATATVRLQRWASGDPCNVSLGYPSKPSSAMENWENVN